MHALTLPRASKLSSEVLVHMLGRLSQTQASNDPFPHFFVENILPQPIYDEMLAAQPETERMQPVAEKHYNNDGSCNRFTFSLQGESINSLPESSQELWRGIQTALASPELKRAVFGKLRSGLAYRYGVDPSAVADLPGFPNTSLMRETRGYSIAPHPDGRRKVVTMQFALPADRSQADLGTTFYQRSLAPGDWLRSPRGFRTVKQMPFIPNCAYAFVVLNTARKKSWHGRETLAAEQGTRNSLLQIYYGAEDGSRSRYTQ